MKYETKRNLLLILTMVFSVIYLIWRLFFTLPISAGGIQLVCGILLFWAEAVTILGTFELYWSKMRNAAKEITPIEIPEELYPHVDVLIATHNEPVDLLYTTVNACTFMEYPDKEKVYSIMAHRYRNGLTPYPSGAEIVFPLTVTVLASSLILPFNG